MRNLKKKIIVLSLAVMFLAGCSNNEEFYNAEPGLYAITMSSGIGAMTKSAIISDDASKLPASNIAVGFFRASDAATPVWNGSSIVEATFKTDGKIVWNTPQYYNNNGSTAHFIGFHPYASGIPSVSGTTATWAIDGKTDILLSDYVSGDKATNKINDNIDLTPHFEHVLSWLNFHIKYDGEDANDVWGNVESIIIKDASQSVLTNLEGLDYNATYGSTTGDVPTYDADWTAVPEAQVLTNQAAFFSQTLVAPEDEYTILVSTENVEGRVLTVTFPNGVAPDAGTKHNVTLTFTLKGITMTATLEPWEDGDNGIVDPIE